MPDYSPFIAFFLHHNNSLELAGYDYSRLQKERLATTHYPYGHMVLLGGAASTPLDGGASGTVTPCWWGRRRVISLYRIGTIASTTLMAQKIFRKLFVGKGLRLWGAARRL